MGFIFEIVSRVKGKRNYNLFVLWTMKQAGIKIEKDIISEYFKFMDLTILPLYWDSYRHLRHWLYQIFFWPKKKELESSQMCIQNVERKYYRSCDNLHNQGPVSASSLSKSAISIHYVYCCNSNCCSGFLCLWLIYSINCWCEQFLMISMIRFICLVCYVLNEFDEKDLQKKRSQISVLELWKPYSLSDWFYSSFKEIKKRIRHLASEDVWKRIPTTFVFGR